MKVKQIEELIEDTNNEEDSIAKILEKGIDKSYDYMELTD